MIQTPEALRLAEEYVAAFREARDVLARFWTARDAYRAVLTAEGLTHVEADYVLGQLEDDAR